MSHEVEIHQAQTLILRELLFRPNAGFAELQKPTELSSDNFNFHIKRLIELGHIKKVSRGKYSLTQKGKEHANKLDTDENTIERQPKVTVILVIEREINGEREYVNQQRLKHPYFGFWGCPTGKVRWGETIIEAAKRELMEETSLTAEIRFCGIYHEFAHEKESNKPLEDKLFMVIHCTKPKGRLRTEFEGGKNEWMTIEEGLKKENYFPGYEAEIMRTRTNELLTEKHVKYPSVDF